MSKSWELFKTESRSSQSSSYWDLGPGNYTRIDRTRLHLVTERSIVASLYNKIAIDVAAVPVKHVKVNQNGRYQETLDTPLNDCLNFSANLDQTGREFIMDCVLSMFDEGCVAIVPTSTSANIFTNNSYNIYELRVGKVTEWFPKDVKVEVYDEDTAKMQELILPKEKVGIVENPFYSVMNERNSTLQRLISKLSLLDSIDNENGSSKMNLLIRVPYTVRTDFMKRKAEDRRKELEDQIKNSEYGVGYIDSSEQVTQLNRAIDNNLMGQIEYLTSMLYNQLGITEKVFDGTADEQTMLNYYNCTVEPILSALTDEMTRKFLTKTARTQRQRIMFIRDPFRLVPISGIAEIADTFTRNEIGAPNELRAVVGWKPVENSTGDELRNRNLNITEEQYNDPVLVDDEYEEVY